MKATRLFIAVLVAGGALAAASCTDRAPTSPGAAPQAGLFDDPLLLPPIGLLQCTPLPYDSVTQTIGPEGGTIVVGPHRLTVPAGVLDTAVEITAVIVPESVNRVRFQPEGLVFNGYVTLRMSYANCDLLGLGLPVRVAYVSPDLLSILDYLPSNDNAFTQVVRGKVLHFSDYAIAW